MKTITAPEIILLSLVAIYAVFGFTGCATTPSNATPEQRSAIEANNWSSFVERVAFNATAAAILYDPKYRTPITAGNAALTLFLKSDNLDYAAFNEILRELDVKAPSSEWGALIEGNLDIEFQRWVKEQQILKISPDVWLRPIAEAVNRGITRGLKQTAQIEPPRRVIYESELTSFRTAEVKQIEIPPARVFNGITTHCNVLGCTDTRPFHLDGTHR